MNQLKVNIQRDDWLVLLEVIDRAEDQYGECSWLGIGEPQDEDKTEWDITRIVYPKQTNGPGSTDMDAGSIATVMLDLEETESIIWWGHSHGKMKPFFSGTDEATWMEYVRDDPDFFFATVHSVESRTNYYQRVSWKGLNFNIQNRFISLIGDSDIELLAKDAMKDMSLMTYAYGQGTYGAGKRWDHRTKSWVDDTKSPYTRERWKNGTFKEKPKSKKKKKKKGGVIIPENDVVIAELVGDGGEHLLQKTSGEVVRFSDLTPVEQDQVREYFGDGGFGW